MKLGQNNIGIDFDYNHNNTVVIGDVELKIVHEWNETSLDDEIEGTKLNGNPNRLEVAPQIGTITIENPRFPYKVGDKVFCHYMAFEWRDEVEYDEKKITLIDGDYILFKIEENGDFTTADNHYLGVRVFEKELVSPGGIILNVSEKPKACRILITHVPKNTKRGYEWIKVGTTVVTVDDHQYPAKINGKEYIKLVCHEIVAELIEEEV